MPFVPSMKGMSYRTGSYWVDWRHLLAGLLVAGGIGAMQPAVALPKNTVVATIAVGNEPEGMVITPNGQTVYVSNFVSQDISVIDTTSNTVTTSIPLGSYVRTLAITPDGQTLFAQLAQAPPDIAVPPSDTPGPPQVIAVISTATNTITNTFPSPEYVGWLNFGVSPDGTQLWVAEWESVNGTVVIIDIATLTTVSTINAPGAPEYVQFAPDGKSAYVLDVDDTAKNPFFKIDVASQKIVWDATVRWPEEFTITPDGATLYASQNAKKDTVAVFNAHNGSQKAQIALPFGTLGYPVVTPNGKYLYVPCYSENAVYMARTADNKLVSGDITVGVGPYIAVVAPNGNYLYVLNFGDWPKSTGSVSVIDISE
jgi:YVTN family beta-propeller protein